MKFNQHQKEAAKTYLESKQNLAIKASAGSGKTSFLVGLSKHLKRPHSAAFVVFTQAAKQVLVKRLGSNFEHMVTTTYSLGYRNLSGYLERSLKVDTGKSSAILGSLLGAPEWGAKFLAAAGTPLDDSGQLKKELVYLHQLSLLNLQIHSPGILQIASRQPYSYAGNTPVLTWMAEMTAASIRAGFESLMEEGLVDFNEMVAWPCLLDDLDPIAFDELLIDEAQDLSPAQQSLCQRSLRPGGQIVLVGDPRQAIYGFAGADYGSFEAMVSRFGATVKDMPINYRCGKAIIEYAQAIDPTIQAHPGAPQGLVQELGPEEVLPMLSKLPECLVLARTNSTLIKLGLQLMKQGTSFRYNRGVLEDRLLGQISHGQRKYPWSRFKTYLKDSRDLAKRLRNSDLLDLIDSLAHFAATSEAKSWATLRSSLKRFFRDTPSAVTLSTIHAAKGDEAPTVIYYGQNLVPHPMATTPQELAQETNLEFIARTRAKQALYLVQLKG